MNIHFASTVHYIHRIVVVLTSRHAVLGKPPPDLVLGHPEKDWIQAYAGMTACVKNYGTINIHAAASGPSPHRYCLRKTAMESHIFF